RSQQAATVCICRNEGVVGAHTYALDCILTLVSIPYSADHWLGRRWASADCPAIRLDVDQRRALARLLVRDARSVCRSGMPPGGVPSLCRGGPGGAGDHGAGLVARSPGFWFLGRSCELEVIALWLRPAATADHRRRGHGNRLQLRTFPELLRTR